MDNRNYIPYLVDTDTHLQELMDEVKRRYHSMEDQVAEMKQQLKNWNKDEEIQKYKDEISQLKKHALYIFNEKEYERFQEFTKFHRSHHRSVCVELQGTGFSTIVKLRCLGCGEVKDISDEESW